MSRSGRFNQNHIERRSRQIAIHQDFDRMSALCINAFEYPIYGRTNLVYAIDHREKRGDVTACQKQQPRAMLHFHAVQASIYVLGRSCLRSIFCQMLHRL